MENENVTVNELIARFVKVLRDGGYSERTLWSNIYPQLRTIAIYHEAESGLIYNPETVIKFAELQEERYNREEISKTYYTKIINYCHRLNEFYVTGVARLQNPRKDHTNYVIDEDNEALIDQFVLFKGYGYKSAHDARWVLRRYFCYIKKNGHTSVLETSIDETRQFILDMASEMKPASMHNIVLYMRHFYTYLKENDIPAPDCRAILNYSVYRDMPIQGYITDDEFERIMFVIDDSDRGIRNRAMILLAATTGLRACDIVHMKLRDVNWTKGEIAVLQKKTGNTLVVPIIRSAGDALMDYILNVRPKCDLEELFLTCQPPTRPLADASVITSMFLYYQKKANIERKPFDGKGFHGLRRRLAKKLLVSGEPLATVAQVLGHNSLGSARQYLALDTSNIRECAINLSLIPVERRCLQ